MRYYSIRFKVEKKDGSHYWFISGYLFTSQEKAIEYAKEYAGVCADADEIINYELDQLIVAKF